MHPSSIYHKMAKIPTPEHRNHLPISACPQARVIHKTDKTVKVVEKGHSLPARLLLAVIRIGPLNPGVEAVGEFELGIKDYFFV